MSDSESTTVLIPNTYKTKKGLGTQNKRSKKSLYNFKAIIISVLLTIVALTAIISINPKSALSLNSFTFKKSVSSIMSFKFEEDNLSKQEAIKKDEQWFKETGIPNAASKHNTSIILIRHAEKLPWEYGLTPEKIVAEKYIDDHSLSSKGFERATALIGYFLHRSEVIDSLRDYPLGALIAQDVDTSENPWGKSERPKQTIMPLYNNLRNKNIPIDLLLYTKRNRRHLVEKIISGEYAGKTVVICWSHDQLPTLAKALADVEQIPEDEDEGLHMYGKSSKIIPNEWPKKRFDVTWVLKPYITKKGKEKHSFYQIPQRLMYGDKDEL